MQTLNPKWTPLKPFQLPLQNVQCYVHYKDVLQAARAVPILVREDCRDFSSQYRCTQPTVLLCSSGYKGLVSSVTSLQSYVGKGPALKHQKNWTKLLNYIVVWPLTHQLAFAFASPLLHLSHGLCKCLWSIHWHW